MDTCNRNHDTIDELLACPPCDSFLADTMPLYTVYAIWEGMVIADIYDGDSFGEAMDAFDAYRATAGPGESVHVYDPHAGSMIAEAFQA